MWTMKLCSLQDIFTNYLLRIPEYQRGYSWKEKQFFDFWEDIQMALSTQRKHYMGVITLKSIPRTVWNKWIEQEFIRKRKLDPFYVIDGQQRLTTALILMQAIIDYCQNKKNTTN